jgi:formylglycine-generating enzyme required for sulfatase activity
MGVISFFACSPKQYSYEIEKIAQGAFTHALLEGLRQHATVERLNHFLEHRVPEIVRSHHGSFAKQTPYTIAEPINKSHLILMPSKAKLEDVQPLKNDAFEAEVHGDYGLAKQLWLRVLAASPADSQAVQAIERLALKRNRVVEKPDRTPEIPQPRKAELSLPKFEFNIVTVEVRSQLLGKKVITQTRRGQAEYIREVLNKTVSLDMVSIPGGTFMIGASENEQGASSDEYPQHQVSIAPFFMSKYPITQAQYEAIAGNNPSHFKGANRPVEQVSWDEAVEFCDRLSQKNGKHYRLPSEAEWEYACRANTTTPFHFGQTITTDLANYRGTDWEYQGTTYPGNYGDGPKGLHRKQTTDVGSFSPNAFGLYDMHGNVWEWCADPWHENYNGAPNDGRVWEMDSDRDNNYRLLRGGSWTVFPQSCRSANRHWLSRDKRLNIIGFRVIVAAPRTP